MRYMWRFQVSMLAGLMFLFSCEPSPGIDNLVQDMVVQTSFDNTVNFSDYSTFSMPLDTIGQIYNVYPNDSLIIGPYAQLISRAVKSNLDNAGYSMVARNQNPDWGINVYVVRNYNISQAVLYPNYYGPSYYPGYYQYSGYLYYPYVMVSATNSAALIMEILDLRNKDSQGRVRVIWTAYIGDVITSPDTFQKSREGVDQAFTQSKYIKK